MANLGTFDADLGMFVTHEAALDVGRARFQRWLAENGRYAEDVGPDQRCPACAGTHAYRLACDIRTFCRAADIPAPPDPEDSTP